MKDEKNAAVRFDTAGKTGTRTYKNPLITSYDNGDPFVMRYDGKYYLYPSTGCDTPYYVQVSDDLVNWSDRIYCVAAEEIPKGKNEHGRDCPIALPAYAPEVTYFNGQFIMVTSLGGTGHQFFVSDSPTGPFKKVGDQWGCKIDGHIFIDNDGKWYFYSAHGVGGLHGFKMTSPTCVDRSSEQSVGAIIDEGYGTWTEGPMVIYHDGTYFLSYTGNHVCHSSYRIAYGTSKDDPLNFRVGDPNPLLISTTDINSGIGHSSTVKAPDLDTYYIVYHSRRRARYLNIDRLSINGRQMTALGPTVENSPVPPMPDIYAQFDYAKEGDSFDGDFTIEGGKLIMRSPGKVLAKDTLERDRYTIELTVKKIDKDGLAGAIFGYKDENNFGEALFDSASEELVVRFTVNGEVSEYRKALVRSFDIPYRFSVTQAIQIEKTGKTFTFYVNDRLLCSYESELDGRQVGMESCKGGASFGYFGAIAASCGTSTKKLPKPIATQCGYIQANHCKEYSYKTGRVDYTEEEYVRMLENETYNYAVYPEKSGSYGLSVCYKSSEGATLSIYADEKYVCDIDLPASDSFTSQTAREIPFETGERTLTVFINKGCADVLFFRCMMNTPIEDSYDLTNPSHEDGIFNVFTESRATSENFSKVLYGSYMLGDYVYSADITPESDSEYGLLARVQNPGVALFTHVQYDDEKKLGGARSAQNWFQGYYFEFSGCDVTLFRCSYRKEKIACASVKLDIGSTYRAEVECKGSEISLYIDGRKLISYTDADAYISGMFGYKTCENGRMALSNVKISPTK